MADPFELQGQQIWPTMLFNRKWRDFPKHVDSIIEELYERKNRASANIASGVAVAAKSMDGLYESEFDLFDTDHEGLTALKEWLADTVRQVVSIANGQKIRPDLLRVGFTEAWSHISNEGGYHDAHYHGDCSWCGIFYVRSAQCRPSDGTGAGNGISRFYRPLGSGGLLGDIGNAYLAHNRVDFTPSDGVVVIFPAYLLHSGLPYRGEDDRILIAFNTKTTLLDS